jgi:mono/diheme cytochrome c family protein
VTARAAEGVPSKTAFKGKCASCHGQDGKGSASMAKMFKVEVSALDLTGKGTLAKKDEDLAAAIAKGRGKMPAYGEKLKADEVKGLVALIRGFAPPAKAAKAKAAKGEDQKAPAKQP